MTDIAVQPFNITDVKTVTNFRIQVQDLELFHSVNVRVELLDVAGHIASVKYLLIDGQDYKNWNNDDLYIVQKGAEKFGLFPISVSPPQCF